MCQSPGKTTLKTRAFKKMREKNKIKSYLFFGMKKKLYICSPKF